MDAVTLEKVLENGGPFNRGPNSVNVLVLNVRRSPPPPGGPRRYQQKLGLALLPKPQKQKSPTPHTPAHGENVHPDPMSASDEASHPSDDRAVEEPQTQTQAQTQTETQTEAQTEAQREAETQTEAQAEKKGIDGHSREEEGALELYTSADAPLSVAQPQRPSPAQGPSVSPPLRSEGLQQWIPPLKTCRSGHEPPSMERDSQTGAALSPCSGWVGGTLQASAACGSSSAATPLSSSSPVLWDVQVEHPERSLTPCDRHGLVEMLQSALSSPRQLEATRSAGVRTVPVVVSAGLVGPGTDAHLVRVFVSSEQVEHLAIADIKVELEKQTGIPAEELVLRCEGELLDDLFSVELLDGASILFMERIKTNEREKKTGRLLLLDVPEKCHSDAAALEPTLSTTTTPTSKWDAAIVGHVERVSRLLRGALPHPAVTTDPFALSPLRSRDPYWEEEPGALWTAREGRADNSTGGVDPNDLEKCINGKFTHSSA